MGFELSRFDNIDVMKNAFETNRVEAATMLHCLVILFVSLALVSGPMNCALAEDEDSPYSITTLRADDEVEVKIGKDKTRFNVQSPAGISQAVIERRGNRWPAIVVVRLHLQGLESLRISNGNESLVASVSSHDDKVCLRMDGQENAPLDSRHSFWMKIRVVRGNEVPGNADVANRAYFEMKLPKALLENNPKSIKLKWIDFYR